MIRRPMDRFRLLLLTCALALSTPVFASAPRDVTPQERALLSPWCDHTIGKPGYPAMLSRYGNGWSHMHHYCYAEIDAMRLNRNPRGKPRGYAHVPRALGNLNYVIERTTPEFAFWKDAVILKIRIIERHVDPAQAIELARQLVRELPELADGYTILAGLLLKTGKRSEALEVLRTGEEKATDQERFALQKSILPLR